MRGHAAERTTEQYWYYGRTRLAYFKRYLKNYLLVQVRTRKYIFDLLINLN